MKIKDIIGERVYHGTPHEVDKFSTDHIGTGEGAQAYGWGLYFASRKEVAEWYKKMLTGQGGYIPKTHWPNWFISQNAIEVREASIKLYGDGTPAQEAVMLLWNAAHKGGTLQQVIDKAIAYRPEVYGTTADEITRVAQELYQGTDKPGGLYSVEIPDDTTFMIWDYDWSKQPPPAKKVLRAFTKKFGLEINARDTGHTIYKRLAKLLGSEKKASLTLLKYGVHGIKHLDGMSRRNGKGTFNYVVFDGALTQITGKE